MRMKKSMSKIGLCLIIATCLCSCFTLNLTPITQTGFERVIESPNVPKNDLYIKVNEWFVKNFTSAESVIQFQDKEEGKIIGKYVSELISSETYHHYFQSTQIISVDIRDNRLRLNITDPCIASGARSSSVRGTLGPCVNMATKECQLAMSENWESLARSLEEYVNTNNGW